MARRYEGNMNGERYCGNSDADNMEVHDLDQENNNCQIDEIIAAGNDVPFNSLSAAQNKGYDNCHWCLGSSTQ